MVIDVVRACLVSWVRGAWTPGRYKPACEPFCEVKVLMYGIVLSKKYQEWRNMRTKEAFGGERFCPGMSVKQSVI